MPAVGDVWRSQLQLTPVVFVLGPAFGEDVGVGAPTHKGVAATLVAEDVGLRAVELVAEGVVGVVMGVDDVADRLVGDLSNIFEESPDHAADHHGVDYKAFLVADYEAGVADVPAYALPDVGKDAVADFLQAGLVVVGCHVLLQRFRSVVRGHITLCVWGYR